MQRVKKHWALLIVALAVSANGFGMGIEVVNNDMFNMNIGGRIQEVAYGQLVHDPVPGKDNFRAYLFLKQARFNVNGRVDTVKYNMEWVGAAEDVNGSNNGLTLLDFAFDVPFFKSPSTWIKVGQFKVPYGRETLTDEAQLQFVDRSFMSIGHNLGRDVGVALHTYLGKFAGTAGVYTGGGRDVPLRFLPEHLGVPMLVARIGLNDGLDKDFWSMAQNDLRPRRTAAATYISGMYMKDTRIGHSTVLNVRTAERSLLLNSNWNPFLAQTPYDRSTFWQTGWDAAARGPVGEKSAWNAEAEFNYASFENKYGKLNLPGVRVQAGFLRSKFEAALRYAVLYPNDNFRNGSTKITGTQPFHELTPAFSYYLRGHDNKIVLDFPIWINVPVFVENAAGSYVSVEQPDQATVIVPAKGHVERQTVPEVRLMWQLAF